MSGPHGPGVPDDAETAGEGPAADGVDGADAVPSYPPPPGERPLRGRVLDVLADAGLAPSLDEDGDVAVVVQGQRLFVRCADGTLPRLRVLGQWQVGQTVAADELTRMRVAGDLTMRLDVVKVVAAQDVLLVAADVVVDDGTDLAPLLTGCFAAVLSAVRRWYELVSGETQDTPGDPGAAG
ncbi:T3SS (YopN, CesT) and YbjN peptide-binding chaperone 1 [Thalassiella azotivora]